MPGDFTPAASVKGGRTTATKSERLPAMVELRKISPYFTLDAWRGIAALWVVMLHSCLAYIQSGHHFFLNNPLYQTSIWGQLGVTMFFVISGYCITGAAYSSIAAGKPLSAFGMDRVRRIYSPYLAASAFAVMISEATNLLRRWRLFPDYHSVRFPSIHDYHFWLSNLTLTQVPLGQSSVLVVAWSLCYEIAFYVIVAWFLGLGLLLYSAESFSRLRALTIGMVWLTVGSLLWLCISPATCLFPFKLWYQFGFGSLLFLYLAVSASETDTLLHPIKIGIRRSVIVAVMLAAVYATLHADAFDATQPSLGHPSSRTQTIATVAFCTLLFMLRKYDARLLQNRGVAAFAHLGAFSYSLYLIHAPLLSYADAGLRRVGFTEGWYLVTYAGQILTAILAGWLFYTAIERRFISKRQIARIAAE